MGGFIVFGGGTKDSRALIGRCSALFGLSGSAREKTRVLAPVQNRKNNAKNRQRYVRTTTTRRTHPRTPRSTARVVFDCTDTPPHRAEMHGIRRCPRGLNLVSFLNPSCVLQPDFCTVSLDENERPSQRQRKRRR